MVRSEKYIIDKVKGTSRVRHEQVIIKINNMHRREEKRNEKKRSSEGSVEWSKVASPSITHVFAIAATSERVERDYRG